MTNTKKWQQMSQNHYLAPFTDYQEVHQNGPRIITKASGVYIFDSEGNKILDGMAGLWCTALGYGREELAQVAYKQMQELPYYNTFFQTAHPPVLELAQQIAEITQPHLNRVFFTDSGSSANDTMLRLVRHYWACKGKQTKKTIISRINAYHGSTVAGASLGGMIHMHEQGDLPIPNIVHIAEPYFFGANTDLNEDDFGVWAANQLEEKILELGINNIAAFIAEPIQGAGGVIIPPKTYWPQVQKILNKYEILFCADEVICGFGRTGKWFGSDYYQLKPDLLTIAKGLTSGYIPMGGLVISDEIYQTISVCGDFNHGFTYSGHPVAAAVGLENLRILREEKIIENVEQNTAPYFAQKLQELKNHPLVGQVRALGLLGAIELVQNKEKLTRYPQELTVGLKCRNNCFSSDLVMRAVGDTMILSPSLVISYQEIDELIHKAKLALDLTLQQLN